jgi:putative SOS response-associated peptidase YedK
MCGRYAVISTPEAIRALLGYAEKPNFPPRYNIAPTQPIAIVRVIDGKRQFALVRWGFIPSWVKDPKTVSLMFNARGETAGEKPVYRVANDDPALLTPASELPPPAEVPKLNPPTPTPADEAQGSLF